MPDYQKGRIYKLYSPSKNIVYIGSTVQTLSRRLSKHLADYKIYNNDNTKCFYSSFLVLECEDYKIEILEEYPCNNKQQLEKKEGEYQKTNECCNKTIAGRTDKEYRLDNAKKLKEQEKLWRLNNVDRIKKYALDNDEKLKTYRQQHYKDNIDRIKKYRLDNADKIKEYNKQYKLKKKLEKQLNSEK